MLTTYLRRGNQLEVTLALMIVIVPVLGAAVNLAGVILNLNVPMGLLHFLLITIINKQQHLTCKSQTFGLVFIRETKKVPGAGLVTVKQQIIPNGWKVNLMTAVL